MRHFIFLLIATVGVYFVWMFTSEASRILIKRFVARHGKPLGVIFVTLVVLALTAFFTGALQLL